MKKNYVLDTNILIHSPVSIDKFEDNNVYIPSMVIEELDKFKTEKSERGYSAREAIRNIGEYRRKGNLLDGIPTKGGGTLFILYNSEHKISQASISTGFSGAKADNQILFATESLGSRSDLKTILVTNDTNMQIKADILGIESQEYKNDRISSDVEIYKGRSIRHIDDNLINEFYKNGKIEVPDTEEMENLILNEFVTLKSWDESKSALAKYDGSGFKKLYNLENTPNPCGLSPRNTGQNFLMEALLSDHTEHPLTLVNGPAGTGKTLLALACGLHQVMEENKYKRVLLCRANVTMDEELGFLPGTEMNKIDPLLRGAYDNLEILFTDKSDSPDMAESKKAYLFERGYIQAQSVAYLRGRSITDTYVIIDEAQNCTPNQILSIITRAGEGSHIVVMGDVNQIDSPRLDTRNNGLIHAIEKMKDTEVCEVVSFNESECTRSKLAKIASDRLKM